MNEKYEYIYEPVELTIDFNNIEFYTKINFASIFRIPCDNKKLYIDEQIKFWIEEFYSEGIQSHIEMVASFVQEEDILFVTRKNHPHIPKEAFGFIEEMSRFRGGGMGYVDQQVYDVLFELIETLRPIFYAKENNNQRFLLMYESTVQAIDDIAGLFGRQGVTFKNIEAIREEVGYSGSNQTNYKLYHQFPRIAKAITSGNHDNIRQTFDEFKIEYDADIVMSNQTLEKYYLKYFFGYATDFIKTIFSGLSTNFKITDYMRFKRKEEQEN